MTKNVMAGCIAAITSLTAAGSLQAHHSLARFDTEVPIWVKGAVVRFERINPHSTIYIDQKTEDGRVHRWAVDGPALLQLDRRGIGQDFLKAGDVIEVCGFATRAGVASQKPSSTPEWSGAEVTGQLMNGHVLLMPDGQKWFWSDYGQLRKCIGPDERGSLLRSPVGESTDEFPRAR